MKPGLVIFRIRYDGAADLFGSQDVHQAQKPFFAISAMTIWQAGRILFRSRSAIPGVRREVCTLSRRLPGKGRPEFSRGPARANRRFDMHAIEHRHYQMR
jgi:hypothetical protein